MKGGSPFRDNFDKRNPRYGRGGHGLPPSESQENDGSVEMGDVHKDRQLRHTPYNIERSRKLVKWHSEDQIYITTGRNRKLLERKMMEDTRDGKARDWFKVTFHYFQNRAHFFVQGASTASALKDVNYTICDDHNRKLAMDKRYDVSQQALDLQSLRFDPDLTGHDIDIILNRRNCMAATLKIIESNFSELLSLNLCNNKLYQLDGLSDITEKAPKVKILNLSRNELRTVWELSKVKGLKLEELWLEGNPLCDNFSDESAYVRTSSIQMLVPWTKKSPVAPGLMLRQAFLPPCAIQNRFPKLLRLDGRELSPAMTVDMDSSELTKPCKVRKKDQARFGVL
ncbi:hypothetical protein P7K49_038854 [Saguinus oedipus]|uniref:Nuclear RNA export factor 2 n=1 Tax=Saguinus oedipus TaxID=9490 RepID=A0ABQ9TGQ3_SAGOE|nr:hypothetical protein P7K49_038854 [Saguinus oedipus]